MSLFAQPLRYTEKDFASLRESLITLIKTTFPEWTDFDVASFGNILLEMMAFVGDVLTFYQDAQARESRISTATQRKNIIALAKLLGYKLPGATAATAEVVFSIDPPPQADVRILKHTMVRTKEVSEPVVFQLLEEAVIPAGTTPAHVTGIVEHSITHTQRFESTQEKDQRIILDHTPYLDHSIAITDHLGAFKEVDSFLGSKDTDRHVVVSIDQNDRATLHFGNGKTGALPQGTIEVTYKTGGGRQGLVNAGSLVVIEGAFTDAQGRPVRIHVTNPNPSSGGADRQSIEEARILAPKSLRVINRTVCREDFEINACKLPGVARVLMMTSNELPSIEENSGILFVIPTGGGMPTQALKDEVLHQVTFVYPHTLTFHVDVQDPVYTPIDVQATIFLKAGFHFDGIATTIHKSLGHFFAIRLPNGLPNPQIDFGFNIRNLLSQSVSEIAWSDVLDVIRDVEGVRKVKDVLLNGQNNDVPLDLIAFPTLGSVHLIHGDIGSTP